MNSGVTISPVLVWGVSTDLRIEMVRGYTEQSRSRFEVNVVVVLQTVPLQSDKSKNSGRKTPDRRFGEFCNGLFLFSVSFNNN